MRQTMVAALCMLLLLLQAAFAEPIKVVVGGYPFRPYVSAEYDGSGVTVALIEMLNSAQDRYHFVFKPISPNRRYQKMAERKIDMIMFEDPQWGWENSPVTFSNPLMIQGEPYRDYDLYVALRKPDRDARFFDTLKGKALLLTRGYHYRFAQYNADEQFIKSQYNAYFVDDPEKVITMLLNKRADIGLVTRSLLLRYIANHPEDRDRFFIADEADNVNNLMMVVGVHAPIRKNEFDQLLEDLQASGALEKLFRQHHLLE